MKKRLLFVVVLFLALGTTLTVIKAIGQGKPTVEERCITVPFKLYFNEIFFQASINGSNPLWVILDSGLSGFIVNEKSAEKLKLPMGNIIDQGYTGIGENRVFEKELKDIKFRIYNAELLLNSHLYAYSFETLEKILGHRVDAVCGRQLFEKYVIEIDYSKRVFKLYNQDKYKYKGKGSIIPIIIDKVPYLKSTVVLPDNKKIEEIFMIDTGLPDAISFTSKFCKDNNLDKQIKTIKSVRFGAGGSSVNHNGRIKEVIIGGYKIDNPIVSLSNNTRGGMARSDIGGLIGNEILKRFIVIFDYANSRMILEPTSSIGDKMEWDMAGVFLYTIENLDQIKVFKVLSDSPADLAGIKEGDEITFIDDVKASNYSIDEISRMFKIENKQYRLGIVRGQKNFEVKINLKKMI